uniref:hypothetical protein n=1 Tax=Elmerina hispida TaxID=1245649 RepID=UPI0030016DDD|nr:hypothetical protein [Elmerina hispida]
MFNTVDLELNFYLNFLYNNNHSDIKKIIYDSWKNKDGILSGKIPYVVFDLIYLINLIFKNWDLNSTLDFHVMDNIQDSNLNFSNKKIKDQIKFLQDKIKPYVNQLKELELTTHHFDKESLIDQDKKNFESLKIIYNSIRDLINKYEDEAVKETDDDNVNKKIFNSVKSLNSQTDQKEFVSITSQLFKRITMNLNITQVIIINHIEKILNKRISDMSYILNELKYLTLNFPKDLNTLFTKIQELDALGYKKNTSITVRGDLYVDYNMFSKIYLNILKKDIEKFTEELDITDKLLQNFNDKFLKTLNESRKINFVELKDFYTELNDFKSKKNIPYSYENFTTESKNNRNNIKYNYILEKKNKRNYSTISISPNLQEN